MKGVLAMAAIAEAATGLVILADPALIVGLLFGAGTIRRSAHEFDRPGPVL